MCSFSFLLLFAQASYLSSCIVVGIFAPELGSFSTVNDHYGTENACSA